MKKIHLRRLNLRNALLNILSKFRHWSHTITHFIRQKQNVKAFLMQKRVCYLKEMFYF